MNRLKTVGCILDILALLIYFNAAYGCTDKTGSAPPPGDQSEPSDAPDTGDSPITTSVRGGGRFAVGEAEADAASGSDGGAGDAGEVDGGVDAARASGADGEYGRLVGMLAAHNAVRARIDGGTIGSLPPLDWSMVLASLAQAYAEEAAASGCKPVGSASGFGENLAYYSGRKPSAAQVVADWATESACYTYGTYMGTGTCTALCDQCGHYTQIVWRDTAEVGCGVATCNGSPYQEIWCCNYNPAGNYPGEFPY